MSNSTKEKCRKTLAKKIQEAIDRREQPGPFIKREMIEPSGQTQKFIAEQIDVHPNTITYLVRGKSDLSADMAVRLSWYFNGCSDDQLMEMQKQYDLDKARKKVLPILNGGVAL